MKKLIKLIIHEFFFRFGWICFVALCLYPIYSFFIEKKVELEFVINHVEIVNYSQFALGMLCLLFFSGVLTFLRMKDYRKKEKEAKEPTEKQGIVECV